MNNLIIHRQLWDECDSFYIMESNGYGMCRLTFYKNENYAEISDLFVQEDKRIQGIATELIKKAIEEFNDYREKYELDELQIYVEDKPNPHSTIKSPDTFLDEFYKKMGFKLNRWETPISVLYKEEKWYKVYTINYKDL